jgi:hypothetical protein
VARRGGVADDTPATREAETPAEVPAR